MGPLRILQIVEDDQLGQKVCTPIEVLSRGLTCGGSTEKHISVKPLGRVKHTCPRQGYWNIIGNGANHEKICDDNRERYSK